MSPARHSACGFRVTTVSTMDRGAGSVGLVDRPILPNTRSTSGKLFSSRSMDWRTFPASVIDRPGKAVGM